MSSPPAPEGNKPEGAKPEPTTLPATGTSPAPSPFQYSITYPTSPYGGETGTPATDKVGAGKVDSADPTPTATGRTWVKPTVKLVALGAGGLLVGFLVVLGVNGWPTRSAPDVTFRPNQPSAQAAPPGQAPPAQSPADRAAAQAVDAWLRGGGQLVINNLSTDYQKVAAVTANNDVQGLVTVCTALRTSAETAQAYPPIPDQEAQVHWSATLAQSARSGTDCLAGVSANYLELVTQAGHEAGASSRESALMNARIATLLRN
jgi:hypothetical protein